MLLSNTYRIDGIAMMNVFIYIMGVIIYIYKEISLWILLVLLYLKVKYMNLFIFPITLLYYVVKTPCDLCNCILQKAKRCLSHV